MSQNYSQFRAMLAITKGSLKAIFRSPSSVAFSFGFPLVFILVFGFISGGGPSVSFVLAHPQDTSNVVIKHLLEIPMVRLAEEKDSIATRKDLEKGRVAAILTIDSGRNAAGFPQYVIHTQTSS
ncbi:MAG TPA: ABC transporter permease, partial [Puia sp.]